MKRKPLRHGRVTAQNVAQLAGVSRSAVSRCFSNSTKIASATREKVLQAARALGYRPNAIARSLTGWQTDLVALIVAEQDNPHTKLVEDRLMERLSEFGKRTLLVPVTEKTSVDESTLYALDYQVDAIVVIGGSVSHSIIDELMMLDLPLFLFGGATREKSLEIFCCDHLKGGEIAARFLLRAGHQRIAFVTKNAETSSSVLRRRGFVQELERAGQRLYAEARGPNTHQGGIDAGLRVLSMDPPPDAVFCFNDVLALGFLEAAASLKVGVPGEVAVIGFDDIPLAAWRAFNLTTIRNDVATLVDALVARMQRRWAGEPATPQAFVVEPTIVVRGTTR